MDDIKKFEPLWGKWYIKELLDEGGYGKVYRIEREEYGIIYKSALKHIKVPKSQSEIKSIMMEGYDNKTITTYYEDFIGNLIKEFALMSKLRGNSHIVSYEDHNIVKSEDKLQWDIFIRMELLTSLIDYISKNEIGRKDIIKLGIDICKALEVCQKYNIIHRDIKPENIFVYDVGDFKLGDFGIARQIDKTMAGLSKKGTYTYIAPEIYKGEAYGSTVDIYSLGLVMYRLLNNNRMPFIPPYPQPVTYNDREISLVKRISGKELPKPVNADGRLAEIVLKACAYNPKDRYENPTLMRKALEAILYSKEEADIIYPDGDSIKEDSIKYVNVSDEKSNELDVSDNEIAIMAFDNADISDDETVTMAFDNADELKEDIKPTEVKNADKPKEEPKNENTLVAQNVDEEIKNKKTNRNSGILLLIIASVTIFLLFVVISSSKYYKYEKAVQLLEEGNAQTAKETFVSLGNYENSAELAMECDYKSAVWYCKQGNLDAALKLLEGIPDYPQSQKKLEEVKNNIYYRAVDYYHTGNYDLAKSVFKRVNNIADSSKYMALINAHTNSEYDINSLIEIIDFEDAKKLLITGAESAYKFLNGKWINYSSDYYVEFTYDESENQYNCINNLPVAENGKFFKLENGCQYYGDDNSGWTEYWSYEIVSKNEINVKITKTGEVIKLVRSA
ncbi:MAG: protein kinase [Lachnospirales bacterium]